MSHRSPYLQAGKVPWASVELKKVATTCTYCGVGCQLELNVKDNKVVKVTSDHEIPGPNQGSLCVKGRFGNDFIDHPDRLTTPLIKENGEFRQASWEEALDRIAGRFESIRKKAARMPWPSFLRHAAPTRKTIFEQVRARGDRNQQHRSLRPALSCLHRGRSRDIVRKRCHDELHRRFENSDVILVTGSNTTEMHPVIGSTIKRAVKSGRCKLIVVDSRKIDLVDHAEIWLRQKPGTDVAWLNGMMHVIIRDELYDKKYVDERTEGFEELKKAVAAYTPEKSRKSRGFPKTT